MDDGVCFVFKSRVARRRGLRIELGSEVVEIDEIQKDTFDISNHFNSGSELDKDLFESR